MIPIGNAYNANLARYGFESEINENILKKVEKFADGYSNAKIKDELLVALKNKDEEKLAEINSKLPTTQEAGEYIRYLNRKGETLNKDKEFKFFVNSYQDLDNNLWFTHQLAMQDTYKDYDTSIDTNHMGASISSVNLAVILKETKPSNIDPLENMMKTKLDKSLIDYALHLTNRIKNGDKEESYYTIREFSSNNSSENQEKSNSIKEPKSLNQVFDERLEFFSADDKTIETRMGSTEETAQEHQKRLEKHKYMYQKNIEYLNTFKDYLLKFDIMQPEEIESDRLLDVKV